MQLYPPVIQHMKDMAADDHEFLDRVIAYTTALEQEQKRISEKLEAGTLHLPFCNGDHTKRVGAEGFICNCPLGQDIHRLQRLVKVLTKDKMRLDGLEALLRVVGEVTLRHTNAWTEHGDMGTILSQGPEAFWMDDADDAKTLREAIDGAFEL